MVAVATPPAPDILVAVATPPMVLRHRKAAPAEVALAAQLEDRGTVATLTLALEASAVVASELGARPTEDRADAAGVMQPLAPPMLARVATVDRAGRAALVAVLEERSQVEGTAVLAEAGAQVWIRA